MSHEATTWAFKQRGLSHAQFRVLAVLADCHNPAHGCFPTQEYLSTECEMSERTIRDTLHSLEAAGLVQAERRANERGHRTGTNYVFAFQTLPANSRKSKPTGNSASSLPANSRQPTGNYLPVDIEAEPVREPVIDADHSAQAPGWPINRGDWITTLAADADLGDPSRDLWLFDRRGVDAVFAWRNSKIPWETVVEVVRDVMARKRDGPPAHLGYFTAAIAQTHANRLNGLTLPEPKPHERRNPDFKTTAERREDSTVAAFRNVFGGPSVGQDEPGHAA